MTTPIDPYMPFSLICTPEKAGSWVYVSEINSKAKAHTLPKGVSTIALSWTGQAEVGCYHRTVASGTAALVARLSGGTPEKPVTAMVEAESDTGTGTIHFSMITVTEETMAAAPRLRARVIPTPPKT